MKEEKIRFTEIELVQNDKGSNCARASKMPRTAVIPVVRDKKTNYINASPYSGGVISLKPYQVFFGIKSWDSKFTFREADEFVIAVPSRSQIHQMWVMACSVPHGINEIDLAGWTEMKSVEVSTPGIAECPLNLECKKVIHIQLGEFLRDIVVGEVVGISIDTNLLNLKRAV